MRMSGGQMLEEDLRDLTYSDLSPTDIQQMDRAPVVSDIGWRGQDGGWEDWRN